MHDAGLPILAGTDTGTTYIFPGFSLHDELALFVRAGLSPLRAIQAATSEPHAHCARDGAVPAPAARR